MPKKAGVSKSLLSLVMRGERHVSAVRREAVKKAGYVSSSSRFRG